MNIISELRKVANALQGRCAPVPVEIRGLGSIGHMSREQGLYINSSIKRPLAMLMQEEAELERVARETSGGLFGSELAHIARRISDRADIIRTIKGMRASLTSWDGIVTAQGNGNSQVLPWKKTGVATANAWDFGWTQTGFPAAGTFSNIPGGGQFTVNSTGSMPILPRIGGTSHAYLTNVGWGFENATAAISGIIGVVDLLVGAGNILAATGTSQNITTTALPRWTTGEGLSMSLVVTTNLSGGTGPTIALTYTDQAGGTGNSTGAIALTSNAAAGRLVPVQDGPMIRFASGDTGVRVIEACIITGTMASGVMAAIIYKPILFSGSLSGIPVERNTPVQTGGMRRITESAGGTLPALTTIRLATSGAFFQGYMEFVFG
jgi:hypothetical protein